MPRIVLTLSGANVTRLVDAFCTVYDYDRTAEEGETRAAFARRMHSRQLVDMVARVEADVAGEAARVAAKAAAHSEVDIIPTEEP